MSAPVSVLTALMREMDSPKGAFDPMPPSQHAYLLDVGQSMENRAMAWCWSKTIHPRKHRRGWKRSASCWDERGFLTHIQASADLGWTPSNAKRVFEKLAEQGRIRIDEKDQIRLCGDVPEPERTNGEEGTKEICTYFLPQALSLYLQRLPQSERAQREAQYFALQEFKEKLLAESMAHTRALGDELEDEWCAAIGYQPEEEKRGRPKKKHEQPLLAVSLTAKPDFVHISSNGANGTSVQNSYSDSYKTENAAVQNAASLLPSESQSFRVSKEAATPPFSPPQTPSEAAAPHHSPTPRPPTPTQNQGRGKNLPVEKEARSARVLASTIEELTGEQIDTNTPLYRQLGELPGRFGIPVRSAQDFFHTKMKELGKRHYRVTAGGLVQMAETDLPKWIERHTPPSEPAQTSAAVLPAYGSVDEEIAELEKFLAAFPHSPSAERDRARLAELRARRDASARGAGGAS